MAMLRTSWLVGALAMAAALAAVIIYQNRSPLGTSIATGAMVAQSDDDVTSENQPKNTAQAGQPARLNVQLPQSTAGTGALSLVLGVGAYKPSEKAADSAVVSLKIPGLSDPIVVGRFSVFPRQSFDASTQDVMKFSLRVQKKVRDLLSAVSSRGGIVSVELIDSRTGKAVDDASMTITDAKIVDK